MFIPTPVLHFGIGVLIYLMGDETLGRNISISTTPLTISAGDAKLHAVGVATRNVYPHNLS